MSRVVSLGSGYEGARREVESVVDGFSGLGSVVHDGRNSIRCVPTSFGLWNVKRYHKPSPTNRIIYTFLRKPKGRRAFLYPARILEAGFETPRPVAYVEEREGGLISYSYFISEQCPYKRRFYEFGNAEPDLCRDVLTAFARMTARLHEARILHLDYSPGNILFDRVDGEWHFSLVDTNRMYFGRVSVERGCKNFARLWGQPAMFRVIADEYARTRGADPRKCREWVMSARNQFWHRQIKKKKPKYTLVFEDA